MKDDGAPMRIRTLLTTVLLVSLGINLFLAGSFVGTVLRPAFDRPPGPPGLQRIVRDLDGRLSPDAMTKIRDLTREIDERIRSGPADPRRLHDELRGLLEAENFDAAAFVGKLDAFVSARTVNDRVIIHRIAEVVAGLSRADRKALAEVALRPPPH